MGKSAPEAPAAPSPAAVGAANQSTALWNASLANANQVTPLGTQSFQLNGNTDPNNTSAPPPQYTETTTLNPQEQQLLNQTTGNMNSLASTAGGLMGQIQSQASNPIDYSKFTQNPTMGDLGSISKNAQDAIMSRLQPDMDLQNEQTNASLLNQGITPGSEAWNNQMRTLNNSQNDAKQQAVLSAGQEAQQLQSTALTSRNQQISEALQQQSQPINEYSALMGQTQVSSPQFASAPSATNPNASVPAGGNALEQNYAQQMQAYNAQLQSQNSTMGSLFGLGGSLGAAGILASSDIRLKTDIKRLGTMSSGLPFYSFQYIGEDEPQIGLMAQDVEVIIPEAVIVGIDGFKMVDYSRVY